MHDTQFLNPFWQTNYHKGLSQNRRGQNQTLQYLFTFGKSLYLKYEFILGDNAFFRKQTWIVNCSEINKTVCIIYSLSSESVFFLSRRPFDQT